MPRCKRAEQATEYLADPFRVQQRKFGAANEAEREVDVDCPQVFALDVEEWRLPCAQHAVDDAPHQRARVPSPLRVGMRADGANLAKVAGPCPFPRHRDKPPVFANADVDTKLDPAPPERPRLLALH